MQLIKNCLDYKKPIIYLIKCKINNKIYIGQSQYFPERYQQHKAGYNKSTHIVRAFNKHGFDNFEFYLLEECSIENLNEREQFYLDFFRSYDKKIGYNSSREADVSRGWKQPESFYKKKEEWFKTHIHPMKGKKSNPLSIEKIKRTLTGRKLTVEQLINHNKFPKKAVKMTDLEGNIIKSFKSVTEAAIELKVNKSTISSCCKGKQKTVLSQYKFYYSL